MFLKLGKVYIRRLRHPVLVQEVTPKEACGKFFPAGVTLDYP